MLELGPKFDRSYSIRMPFENKFFNIKVFYKKKNSFCLFSVDENLIGQNNIHKNLDSVYINMFKNLESSKFCETFLHLHTYRQGSLDIINQFDKVLPIYEGDVTHLMNESVILSKIVVNDRTLLDTISLYGFTITSYQGEYVFMIAERQFISKKLEKKIVRTIGCQIATTYTLEILDEYLQQSRNCKEKYNFALDTKNEGQYDKSISRR